MRYPDFVTWVQSTEDDAVDPVSSSTTSRSFKVAERVSTELRRKFDAAIDSGKIKSYEDVFKAMDSNGDGRVSRREFERGLRDLRVRLSFDDSDDLMKELDRDGDGQVAYREFAQFLRDHGRALKKKGSAVLYVLPDRAKRDLINKLDKGVHGCVYACDPVRCFSLYWFSCVLQLWVAATLRGTVTCFARWTATATAKSARQNFSGRFASCGFVCRLPVVCSLSIC